MQIVKNYRKDDKLRAGLNSLTERTFGFDFEGWYQNGFWNDKYIPYSILEDEKIVANVSVNIIDINDCTKLKHYIQLGTVMTDENYRNKGYSRVLMDEIFKDYDGKVDGIYLFANDEVLDFYPKFGFVKAKEYQYSKKVSISAEKTVVSSPMDNNEKWQKLVKAFNSNVFHGGFDMVNNLDLMMFHITSYMQNSVYFDEKSGAYIIADVEGENLFIHAVFSPVEISLDDVINMFGKSIKSVTLGFTPIDAEGWNVKEYHEEDTTLFTRGFSLDGRKVIFQTLSHA